jgi:hypothetical protein
MNNEHTLKLFVPVLDPDRIRNEMNNSDPQHGEKLHVFSKHLLCRQHFIAIYFEAVQINQVVCIGVKNKKNLINVPF